MEKYRVQDYKKHLDNDMNLAQKVFNTAYAKQIKNPDKLVNVGYGYKVTKNNLEDVKLLTDFKMNLLETDFSYGLLPKPYVEKEVEILKQLKKSIDKTIKTYYTMGEK